MPEKRYIGVKGLAEYLDVTDKTIYHWTFTKQIPYIKLGRLLKFDLKEIDKWIDERRVKEFESQ